EGLPGGESGHGDRCRRHVIEGGRLWAEVPRLDGDVLGGSTVAVPIRQAVDGVADGGPGRPRAERLDHPGHLVARHNRAPIPSRSIDPGRRPTELVGCEAGGSDANEYVTYAEVRDRKVVAVLELLRPTLLARHERFHGAPLF